MQVVIDYHYELIDYHPLKKVEFDHQQVVIDYQTWLIDYQSLKID